MSIVDKMERYLNDTEEVLEDYDERLFDLVASLDPEQVSEEQAYEINSFMEELDIDELDEVKKIKIKSSDKRANKKAYRKNKAKLKIAAKKYRKSSKGKLMAKKAKKMASRGRTATGKKKVSYR